MQLRFPEVQPFVSQNFSLGSCFRWILRFSMLKASVDLPQLFLAIYSATLYPFENTSRIKRPPLDILELPLTKLRNQYKKVAFVQVDEYGALEIHVTT